MGRYRNRNYPKPVLEVVDFTNSIGQVIKPGDDVVVITSGYNHRIRINRGIYHGRKGVGNGVNCTVFRPSTQYRYIDTKIDTPYSDWPKYPSVRYGTPEYTEAHNKYEEDIEAFKLTIETYTTCTEGSTTLQRNRIFKIDTPVFDIKL